METIQDWQQSLETKGLIETLGDFSDYVAKKTGDIVYPGYSFAHVVIDDYNLSDSNIEFCLKDAQVNEWLLQKLKDIDYQEFDSIREGDDEYLSFDYWDLVWGGSLTIDFMRWLMTIPEDTRDIHWNRYHGLPDEPTDEDWQQYLGRGTAFNPDSYPPGTKFLWVNPNTGWKPGEGGKLERTDS